MKQVLQHLGTGRLEVMDVAEPTVQPAQLLVASAFSLISPGTERATTVTAKKSLVGKARARPDLVRQVIRTAKTQGIRTTAQKVRDRLDTLKPLGYSSAGTVIAVGEGCPGFEPGDRVACAGGGYATHSEVISVPRNLCARIPEGVPLEQAAFSTLGAIALHGVRQAQAQLGDRVAVIGLGLVGQLCVQLLSAAGCRVLAVDLKLDRLELACKLGAHAATDAEASRSSGEAMTVGQGFDSVIVAASASNSDPVSLAADLLRDRGRLVIVGSVGMTFDRETLYAKEIEVRLSRSYGPGRYDPMYEEYGVDYPIGYVRWTEQRNLSAFLDLLAGGSVDVGALTTHRFPIEQATDAYRLIENDDSAIGVLLSYPHPRERKRPVSSERRVRPTRAGIGVALIGAGNFAQSYLLPHLARHPRAELRTVVTRTGSQAQKVADKHGFRSAATDAEEAMTDPDVDVVFIATRHNLHASLASAALRAGKSVFVEKPAALSLEELRDLQSAFAEGSGLFTVGFNRRFAPLTTAAHEVLSQESGPTSLSYRVSAGPLTTDHWLRDPVEGGGRILGEMCHFVDYARHFCGGPFESVYALCERNPVAELARDTVQVLLRSATGSTASIFYTASGDASLEKERVEVFRGARTVVVEDFVRGWRYASGRRAKLSAGAGKGHGEEITRFLDAVHGGMSPPVPFAELVESTEATLAIVASLDSGGVIDPSSARADT